MAVANYIGVPFNQYGSDPEHGWNCWTLCVYVAWREHGIELPSYQGRYSVPLDYDELSALICNESETCWRELEPGSERPGDVVILRLQGLPIHAGLVIEPGLMLHVHEGIDTVTESYRSLLWRKRVSGLFRYEHT